MIGINASFDAGEAPRRSTSSLDVQVNSRHDVELPSDNGAATLAASRRWYLSPLVLAIAGLVFWLGVQRGHVLPRAGPLSATVSIAPAGGCWKLHTIAGYLSVRSPKEVQSHRFDGEC